MANVAAPNIPLALASGSQGPEHLITDGFDANAQVTDDGRVDIALNDDDPQVASLLDALQRQTTRRPSQIRNDGTRFPVRLNVVIHVVGSRGDVQPFIALGRAMKRHGHRVRLATHLVFRDFVKDNGLEFFNIGGDPAELMSFMVKNDKLIPKVESFRQGAIGKRRKEIRVMLGGCWRSCIEAGEGLDMTSDEAITAAPFVADAIIANPPSFAHIHCAEKLAIPLHLIMPWSPTQAFSHPLANVRVGDTKPSVANFASYALMEMVIWQGVGDLINAFRRFELGLEQLDVMRAPSLIPRLRVPFTYMWSPSLLPKPDDWQEHIDVTGFNFLPANADYVPPSDLVEFLDGGPPPLYIGFGSIVVDDPDALTKTILDAVEMTGQRALISKGWGGLGAEQINRPDVFFLGNCPHDWLFPRVSCVIHHGGAGTTAAGLALGRPTTIVPFFGDQPFWGALIAQNGAGPPPIPYKKLTADRLADAIHFCLKTSTIDQAQTLAEKIRVEDGARDSLASFHSQLDLRRIQCTLCPGRAAVWRVRRTKILLSAFAATVLVQEKKLNPKDVKMYRGKRYDINPRCAGADSFTGAISNFLTGLVDMPVDAVYNISRPAADRFAENYNLPSCEARIAMFTPAGSVAAPSTTSQKDRVQTTDDVKSTSSLSSSTTTQSQEGTPSMAVKRNPLQRIVINSSYLGRRVLNWVVEVPMGVTLLFSQFTHNAPRYYNDRTVRELPEVIGVRSGFVAAGKEFGYSWYDGVTGVVTQPSRGWKDGGLGGMSKGIGKGLGGLILKPQAGIWGLIGYPLNGVHRAIEHSYGADRQGYIVRSRIRQGVAEAKAASQEERMAVLENWSTYEKGVRLKHERKAR
ncbi:glycosyltransferase family 28 [Aspergillus bombycis]|uniref:Glycosyltransferase family 28 n=1 Tax=Aspergillus bombycis TaxID=109264 RepID=A0A1F8A027_9EURO|nr:glycosyltransferase family 28 [Aspergillus bombycis]OGM45051.1 glycosyltransferase family 28 [Aspergillus bombycis]